MLFPTPNLLLPLVTPRASFTSAFISLAWIVGLPVAGLAALGLPTYRTLLFLCLSPVPSSLLAQSTRGCTCAQNPMFFGSSCAHTSSASGYRFSRRAKASCGNGNSCSIRTNAVSPSIAFERRACCSA